MKIWAKTAEFSEGKFLVVRRDGTIPDWPHFVLGARDLAAPRALHAYANAAAMCGMDPAFCESVRELAYDFDRYRLRAGPGDPDAPPHRIDNQVVLALMRRKITMTALLDALDSIAKGMINSDCLMTDPPDWKSAYGQLQKIARSVLW